MNMIEIIRCIDPSELSYDDWLAVGMAIKNEGYSLADWDEWSKQDSRYKEGECEKKWDTFTRTGRMIGTIVHIAREHGVCLPYEEKEYQQIVYDDWSFTIPAHDKGYVVAPPMEPKYIVAPTDWDPKKQIIDYLNALFDPEDIVGYVLNTTEDGKPKGKGSHTRTASEIITALNKNDIDQAMLCTPDTKAGGWVRVNPLDGHGVADANITSFKHVLVEADDMDIEDQASLYEALELPIAALVNSGNKSLHAVVKIDATTREEYDKRTNFLFDVLEKNGLEKKARRNRNPSRLSRLPGLERGFNKQFLISTHTGKSSFLDWEEWIQEINDNLPDFENWEVVHDSMPELAPVIIADLLRRGHKLLVSGASKAGKSFLLLELAMAVAHGKMWLGWSCAQGKVLYVNLELDRASCFNRIKMIEDAMGLSGERHVSNRKNIEVWNLRGSAEPMHILAPKLIRRAKKKNFDMIIIDPIYKVITGAENEAGDMAVFCNQFDKVAHQLGASVVYCHHHSKGDQGQKRSVDRASGSGVFSRDPDAIMDLIELNPIYEVKEAFYAKYLGHESPVSLSAFEREQINNLSAWRIECALREFATPPLKRVWFNYPVHLLDNGSLDGARASGETISAKSSRIKNDYNIRNEKSTTQMINNVFDTIIQLDGNNRNFVYLEAIANAVNMTMESTAMIIKKHAFLCYTTYGRVYEKKEIASMAIKKRAQGMTYNEFADKIGLNCYANPKVRISSWIRQFLNKEGNKYDAKDDIRFLEDGEDSIDDSSAGDEIE